MNMKTIVAGAALALSLAAGSAQATALTPGLWAAFTFGGAGSGFSDTFTFSGPGALKVTDAFLSGDRFELFDNGVSLGLTSAPATTGDQIYDDYDGAYADARWSHGAFLLGAGNHSITGLVTLSPYGTGGAALQLAGGVPEPSIWAMMLAGVGLMGASLRRRRTVAAAA